jgi:hypothetical protein
MTENMATALANEIGRNRELLEVYKKIPTGGFGAAMIDADIKFAISALASGDVIEILKAYERMKNNE